MDAFERRNLFNRAVEEVEKRGWARGRLCNRRTGTVCMLGAIYAAHLGPNATSEDIYRRGPQLQTQLPVHTTTIIGWNDRQGTKESVIERLRALGRGENPFDPFKRKERS